jgi:S-adenosylmethionine synthetase
MIDFFDLLVKRRAIRDFEDRAVSVETIKEIGYNDSAMGFDWETCAVITSIDEQSADIKQGVDESGRP